MLFQTLLFKTPHAVNTRAFWCMWTKLWIFCCCLGMWKHLSQFGSLSLPPATFLLPQAPLLPFSTGPPDALRLFSWLYRSCHSLLACNHLIPLTWASLHISPPAPHSLISHSPYILVHFLCSTISLSWLRSCLICLHSSLRHLNPTLYLDLSACLHACWPTRTCL